MRPDWYDKVEIALNTKIRYGTPFTFDMDDWTDLGVNVFLYFQSKPDMRIMKHKINHILRPTGFHIRLWDYYRDHKLCVKVSIDKKGWLGPILDPQS